MNRFQKGKPRLGALRVLLPVLIFCIMLLLLLGGLSSVSSAASRQEAERLRDSVLQSAVQCYALEGFYPEDLTYLKEHYGLTYDSEKYVVSYEIIGSNLMPDVSVISLDKGGNGS